MPHRRNLQAYGHDLVGRLEKHGIGHDVGGEFVRRHSGNPSSDNDSDTQGGKPEEVKPDEEEVRVSKQSFLGLRPVTA